MNEHRKLRVDLEYPPTCEGFVSIVDEETRGRLFYEEVTNKERAERFVKCANSHDELLAACEAWENAIKNGDLMSVDLGTTMVVGEAIELTKAAISNARKGSIMGCEICDKSDCIESFHSIEEQQEFETKTGRYAPDIGPLLAACEGDAINEALRLIKEVTFVHKQKVTQLLKYKQSLIEAVIELKELNTNEKELKELAEDAFTRPPLLPCKQCEALRIERDAMLEACESYSEVFDKDVCATLEDRFGEKFMVWLQDILNELKTAISNAKKG